MAAYRGQAPNLLEKAGTDISEIRSGAISYAIEKGDKVVKEIVEDACEYLAMSVVTMVHLLAPDVIVFGGGMIEAMEDTMLPIIKKRAQKRILPAMRDVYKLVPAKLGDDAGVMGAAALAKQAVKENLA